MIQTQISVQLQPRLTTLLDLNDNLFVIYNLRIQNQCWPYLSSLSTHVNAFTDTCMLIMGTVPLYALMVFSRQCHKSIRLYSYCCRTFILGGLLRKMSTRGQETVPQSLTYTQSIYRFCNDAGSTLARHCQLQFPATASSRSFNRIDYVTRKKEHIDVY